MKALPGSRGALPARSARRTAVNETEEPAELRLEGVRDDVVYLTGGQCRACVEVAGYELGRLTPSERADPRPTYDALFGSLGFPVAYRASLLATGTGEPIGVTRPQGGGLTGALRRLGTGTRALLGRPAKASGVSGVQRHRFHLILQGASVEELRTRSAALERALWRAGLSMRRLAGAELEQLARSMDWSWIVEGTVAQMFSTTTASQPTAAPSSVAPAPSFSPLLPSSRGGTAALPRSGTTGAPRLPKATPARPELPAPRGKHG